MASVRATDKRIACDEEFSDSEDEGEGGRRNVSNHKRGPKRPRVDEEKKETEEQKSGVYYCLPTKINKKSVVFFVPEV